MGRASVRKEKSRNWDRLQKLMSKKLRKTASEVPDNEIMGDQASKMSHKQGKRKDRGVGVNPKTMYGRLWAKGIPAYKWVGSPK